MQRRDVRFQEARRINRSFTAAAEKRVLTWMAARMPTGVTSDHLTLMGLAAQLGAGASYAMARWDRRALVLAIVCILFNWLGDSLDGTLARNRRQERPRYGFYVDHVVDIAGSVFLMCGLGYSGLLHWPVAMSMLVAFLALSCESYLATYSLGTFQLSQGIFGPTEIRILLIAGNLAAMRSPFSTLFGFKFLLFDLGGTVATVAMGSLALIVAVKHIHQLYEAEPLS